MDGMTFCYPVCQGENHPIQAGAFLGLPLETTRQLSVILPASKTALPPSPKYSGDLYFLQSMYQANALHVVF